MKYISTRGHDLINFDQAIQSGLAPDGGLYVPQTFPTVIPENLSYAELATKIISPLS